MRASQVITTTHRLSTVEAVEVSSRSLRDALGSAARFDHVDASTLLAWTGSRTRYRLMGVWAGRAALPMTLRFDLEAGEGGTLVSVTMSSDQGRYLLTMPEMGEDYRARFDQVLADLARAGFLPIGAAAG